MTDQSQTGINALTNILQDYENQIKLLKEENAQLSAYKEEELKERTIVEQKKRKEEEKIHVEKYGLLQTLKNPLYANLKEDTVDVYIDVGRCRGSNPCSHIVRWVKGPERQYIDAKVMTADDIYDMCMKNGKDVLDHFEKNRTKK